MSLLSALRGCSRDHCTQPACPNLPATCPCTAQVSAPRRACMLPIGRLFNGISATLKGKPGTLRLASEATGDASTDPCYTLEGWKLDSTAVAFDDLTELPQLQGSGLSVCRRESFHLHLAFQDQFGAPIEV